MPAKLSTKDEYYVLDHCDQILGLKASRQHRFDFLLGDQNAKGFAVRLPVDAYYETLCLVIEYRERQHSETINFFDKPNRITVSGVHRGIQRQIYDERRRVLIPQNGLKLLEIPYSIFNYDRQKRIIRNETRDKEIIVELLHLTLADFKRMHPYKFITEKRLQQN